MCVNKLYIRNNRLDFDPLVDRAYNYVCCGKCEECLNMRKYSYEIRAIAEFENTKSLGCSSHFYTLTYAPGNLPVFEGVPCFSKPDIQKFFKRLRKYLVYHGYNTNFRYFLTSEYGHEKTHNYRPHYHLILYMRNNFSPVVLNDIIQQTWKLGHVEPGSENLGLIKDVRPFGYCVKYMCKDDDVNDYLDSHYDYPSIRLYLDNKRDVPYSILPFHLQSKGFGSSLISAVSDTDFINGYIVRTDSLGISRKIPIPLYIKRKCLYDSYINENGNVSYVLNQRGKNIFVDMTKKSIINMSEKYNNLVQLMRFDDVSQINVDKKNESLIFYNESCFEKFKKEFVRTNYGLNLASYVVMFKDRQFIDFDFSKSLDYNARRLLKWSSERHALFDTQGINNKYPYIEYDNILLSFFDKVEKRVGYCRYKELVNNYNLNQQYLSAKTGRCKYIKLKSYSHFINQNSNRKCLSMLSRREKPVQPLAQT